jgi:hypothetical protein
MNHLDNWTLRP